MSLLDALFKSGHLRTLDHALAQSLRRLDPSTPDTVLAAAALASLAVAKGHAGLPLAQPQALLGTDAAIDWPAPADWAVQLAASRWVAAPESVAAADSHVPLVLERDLLYLRRYREYERALASDLQRIAAYRPDGGDIAALAPLFAQLFPQADGEDDRQARAAALSLQHALLLVTGGPGTGKTTTTTRLLALLIAQAKLAGCAPPRIALAAPTGRAAERMAESVRQAVQSLAAVGLDVDLLAALPSSGTTLHRLLGTIPDSPRFRHHADHPLPFDVVVVDEASMIDLPLMAKLADAVATGTRLVLLGDPDQLPSVEAGDVLAAILAAAGDGETLSADDAETWRLLHGGSTGGRGRAEGSDEGQPFAGRRVHLQRGWRQHGSLQLAPLATAVRAGEADAALSLLRGGELSGVHFHEDTADPLQVARAALLEHWQSLADAADPAEALARANRLRILTALREGPHGARALNARIEAELTGPGARRGAAHFHGQLLVVTENNYRQHLFNGDTGICLRDEHGELRAWFPGDDPAQPRVFHPAALPAHESAFAMTVHKAQGSEFDVVWLLLPARGNRVLSRELVYTGLTRARRELHLAASESTLRDALSRHAHRWSGLGRRLRKKLIF
ncbi:exodeoxyribonuclease V subunit alpha [Pseudoxanthomonas kalamensis DSM 18571]|uniref:exodeoxyribonuclease V subunit alpha n=1 Tax=Pseudoxanthomonas kalamensis TaxID=289483 RepID=UPI00139120F0|nr:exodeoxyribonuclease V subunit alpha [Pseudoxanthomonas kalamensis]KAF1712298.1 exodeoxyribonuclease V subunit alpha [Pseudoxanthomonas kalamensis DSM 18571]